MMACDLGGVFYGSLLEHYQLAIPGGVIFLLGLYAVFAPESAFHCETYRRLKNVQMREIVALTASRGGQGVRAQIWGKSFVNAPASGTACLWYAFSIWEVDTRSSSKSLSLLAHEVEFSKHAYLEDKTGRCEIALRHVSVSKDSTEVGSSGFLDPVNENEKKILDQYRISSTNVLGMNKKLLFEETVILSGERLVVAGRCVKIKDEGFGDKRFESDSSLRGGEPVLISGPNYVPARIGRVRVLFAAVTFPCGFLTYATCVKMIPEWYILVYYVLFYCLAHGWVLIYRRSRKRKPL